jgi:acyl-CoA reductase-like NAD-dependent aldehyde dehydrogenase
MSPEERMTIDEQRKYLHKMRIRYWQARSRQERSQLLDEMQAVPELHRKSLIRLINGELARKPRRKQRGKTFGPEVKAAVEVIAQSLDYPCAELSKHSPPAGVSFFPR